MHNIWTSGFSSGVIRSKGNNVPDWSILLVFCKCWMMMLLLLLLLLCQVSQPLEFIHRKQLMQERSCGPAWGRLCLREQVNSPLVMSWNNWEEFGGKYQFILALGLVWLGKHRCTAGCGHSPNHLRTSGHLSPFLPLPPPPTFTVCFPSLHFVFLFLLWNHRFCLYYRVTFIS